MKNSDVTRNRFDLVTGPFGQYKYDLFTKLGFSFDRGKTLLDVGCGECSDTKVFRDIYGLNVCSMDIYEHENVKKYNCNFTLGSILEVPFEPAFFDYVFVHDILHHIDEERQSKELHIKALENLKRVVKPGGYIIIVEANRNNPLSYLHMVRMLGHNHFTHKYFVKLVRAFFPGATFKSFEAHCYPRNFYWLFKIYDYFMDNFLPEKFRSYNTAIIKI